MVYCLLPPLNFFLAESQKFASRMLHLVDFGGVIILKVFKTQTYKYLSSAMMQEVDIWYLIMLVSVGFQSSMTVE